MTAKQSIIHVRLGYGEAVESKREILSIEADLLRTLQAVHDYHEMRAMELKKKVRLHRKLKELITKINKLQKDLPKIQLPEILKEHRNTIEDEKNEIEETPKVKTKKKASKKRQTKKKQEIASSIEDQIRQIQEKLDSLE